MKLAAIDSGRIEAMLAQLKAAAQKPAADPVAMPSSGAPAAAAPGKLDFAQALRASLDQVNAVQANAETLGKNFVMGDDTVSLSDVMISMQKANISFQATVQVRNKLVAAYHDMMNMQV
jgi:flagellar hook-basal body complex protein FliE